MPFDQEFYVASPRSEPAMPIGHQRLLVLAEFLETKVPRKQFDLALWASHAFEQCGTAACAGGWACTIPAFKALGLRLGDCGPEFRDAHAFDALDLFFEIDGMTCLNFFWRGSYDRNPGPRAVAARIRTFVAEQSIAARTAELTRLD